MAGDLLRVRELAAETGLSDEVIYKAVADGKLAHIRFSPKGGIRIARADWERYLERHRREARDAGVERSGIRSAAVETLPGARKYATG